MNQQRKIQFLFVLATFLSLSLNAATFNIRNYGAKGDKTANDTSAIQAAIDACNQSGGGEVLVPAGNFYSGKLTLKSNITFDLENGATIWESDDILDFDKNPPKRGRSFLFVAVGQENIVICGGGKIVGTGLDPLGRTNENKSVIPPYRFGTMQFADCRNVCLRDFQILDSEAFTIVLDQCEDVHLDGLAILNNFLRINTDGIDPSSCTNVFISNCHIVAGDDCICLKTRKGAPLENAVVNNCVLESIAGAIKLGTGSSGDFRDIKVSNCVIRNSGVGIGLFIKDGGTVDHLSFSNISIETTRQGVPINSRLRNNVIPIYIDLSKRSAGSPLSHIRDVTFSNIQIASDNSIVIQGLPQQPIENLTLRDIMFRVNDAFDFSQRTKREGGDTTYRDENQTLYVRQPTWCALANIKGFLVDNLRLVDEDNVSKQFPRSVISIFNSQDGAIKNISREPTPAAENPSVVILKNCNALSSD